jgi:hypothetical protein
VAALKGYSNPLLESPENLSTALDDHAFARALLGRVGEAERERFNEAGWAYGDPSEHYGTDPFEVLRFQADAVARTLFGEAVGCELYLYTPGEEALAEFLSALRSDDDGSCPTAPLLGDLEPDEAEGYLHLLDDDDEILVAMELAGSEETVWRLRRALHDEIGLPTLHYFDPETEPGRGSSRSRHLILAETTDFYPERAFYHQELFWPLVRAWELMRGPDPGGPDATEEDRP